MAWMFEKLFGNGSKHSVTPGPVVNGGCKSVDEHKEENPKPGRKYFQMPLHYPRFKKADYENMAEWQLDCLLASYGLPVTGNLEQKRKYAMGAFLWD